MISLPLKFDYVFEPSPLQPCYENGVLCFTHVFLGHTQHEKMSVLMLGQTYKFG